MKLYSPDNIPFEPVSHDPGLKKKVLIKDSLPFIRGLSHILLAKGNKVSFHNHPDAFEVLYSIRGEAIFTVEKEEVTLKKGECLVIEPGEGHAINAVIEDTELLYFKIPERGHKGT